MRGELNRKQFKEISKLTAPWTNEELSILSVAVATRSNIHTVFSKERLRPIAHLFGGDGRVYDNQLCGLLQEVIRGHLLEREYAQYLLAHPIKPGPKKGTKYGN